MKPKKPILLLAIILAVGGLVFTWQGFRRTPGATDLTSNEASSVSGTPSFESVVNLIVTRKLRTVEETLKVLREIYPQWMSSYVLGYHSGSLQKATYTHPRAIIFGDDAKFVLSFNGDPKLEGYGALETMSYDAGNGSYSFREIVFRDEADIVNDELVTYENRGEHIAVSGVNPMRCLDCHGVNRAHPIWETYFDWPGFYGSNDDNLYRADKAKIAFSRGMVIPEGPSNEDTAWAAFSANPGLRYRHLPPLNSRLGKTGSPRPNSALLTKLFNQSMDDLVRTVLAFDQGEAWAMAIHTVLACGKDSAKRTVKIFQGLPGMEAFNFEALKRESLRLNLKRAHANLENLNQFLKHEPNLNIGDALEAPEEFRRTVSRSTPIDVVNKAWAGSTDEKLALIELIMVHNRRSLQEFALPFRRFPNFDSGRILYSEIQWRLRTALENHLRFSTVFNPDPRTIPEVDDRLCDSLVLKTRQMFKSSL